MLMRLYRPTQMLRRTLNQEAALILPVETSAPTGSHRRVQIVVPVAPKVHIGVDVEIQGAFGSPGVGPDRDYKLPQMAPGQAIEFRLAPEQWLIGSSRPGLAYVSLIVEYLEPGS